MNPIIVAAPNQTTTYSGPDLHAITQAQLQLATHINTTPLCHINKSNTTDINIRFKLEIWQLTGTFKIRAALLHIMQLTAAEKQQGIVALSGGNHAIAVSYAAQKFNIPATVIMPKTASPLRIKYCRDLGATVILEHDLTACFTKAEQLQQQGLTHIHPFDSQWVALGTGTLGLEIIEQWPECDIIISAVGGGGLCAGIANAIKQRKPSCQIFGVEPNGANAMSQSFRQGYPIKHIEPNTIADSLASPCALPYTYSLCQQHLDGIVNVSDTEIQQAMRYGFEQLQLTLEPACASAIAALHGPLQETCENKNTAVVLCGTNIDLRCYLDKLQEPHRD
jgi:threonine dehydratase